MIQVRGVMRAGLVLTLWGYVGVAAHAQTLVQPSQYEMRTDKQQAKRVKAMSGLTAEAVAAAVSIQDDPFEPVIVMSSSASFPSPKSFTDNLYGDNHFRVFINRTTGAASFQLYQTLGYLGEWRNFEQVNVMLPGGLRTKSLTRIDNEIRQCFAIDMCGRTDIVGFDLTETDMEAIAAMKPSADGTPALLKFRYKSMTSFDWTDDIAAVEAEGVLLALKRWREAKGL